MTSIWASRSLVTVHPGEEDAGAAVADLHVLVLAQDDVPAEYLAVEVTHYAWVVTLQIRHAQARDPCHPGFLP
jgi:hypothetical protein